MINLYSTIKNNGSFNKIEVNELLFVEYTCMQEATRLGLWSDNNYFAFISSGKKMWSTIHHSYVVNDGDIIFVKKGANLTHQFFDDRFCAIFIFIPDDFILSFLRKNSLFPDLLLNDVSRQDAVLRVEKDDLLEVYHASIQSYLSLPKKPHEQLMLLKFEELLLSLFSNERNKALTDYFISLSNDRDVQMSRAMEANYAYNLRLEAYAQLCHMSLSTFKKSFKQYYRSTPASWLQQKRLELALHKLRNTDLPVARVSLECGFEDTSHFIRVFKRKYQATPLQIRGQQEMASQ